LFSPAAFIATGSLVGFGFGACFVLYAAQVAATHGVNQVGRIYPFLFLSYGIAGIAGPLLGGLLHDWTGRYSASLIMAALVSALGAWLTWRGVRESPTRATDAKGETPVEPRGKGVVKMHLAPNPILLAFNGHPN
jgi:MFS family permease